MVLLSGLALSLLSLVPITYSCSGHEHQHHQRLAPSSPLTPPSRPLQWGDVNIIHTTDTHGWLLGHQKHSFPEPNYSGDFGDFFSFVAHMKKIAHERDVDLLLVDTGDLHDGTGISDGYPPGGVDAHDSNEFFKELPYDVLAIGNHELYVYANTLDMYRNFVPRYKGRYLSSNVNITITDPNGNPISVPVGSRYLKFHTTKGRRVTALGVIYDFTGNAQNTTVQKVEDMVKENWFAEAIADEPDFFLLTGHMPIAGDKWPCVFNAIRAVHPHTPILIFGGHSHIRDCNQLDGRSMSLESGRYMETVGWMSVNLTAPDVRGNLSFSRRYLDANRVTYEYHTSRSDRVFDTAQGKSITKGLQGLWERFNLSYVYGNAPQDFTLTRSPYPSNASILSELIDKALPYVLALNNTRASIPNIIIVGAGSQRFDIFAGQFDRNDQLTSSPFKDSFLYIPNVKVSVATQVLPYLNNQPLHKRDLYELEGLYGKGDVIHIYNAWLKHMNVMNSLEGRVSDNLTPGYVTHDSCPGVGDDIPHTPIPYHDTPTCIGTPAPNLADDATLDLVFDDFFSSDVLRALNTFQKEMVYTNTDVRKYSPVLINEVWGLYAQANWN